MNVPKVNVDACEKEIITRFKKQFVQVLKATEGDFGRECFEIDDENIAIGLFLSICMKYR